MKWLMRPHGAGGPGCTTALSETKSGWRGETPDAIGYRFTGTMLDGTVVVEVKTSRADFLADRKKPHRISGGMGDWRYFMAPQGLIKPEELPDKWGLLEVCGKSRIQVTAGPHGVNGYSAHQQALLDSRFDSPNRLRELFIIVRLSRRLGDADELNEKFKAASRMHSQYHALEAKARQMERELTTLRLRNERLSKILDETLESAQAEPQARPRTQVSAVASPAAPQ